MNIYLVHIFMESVLVLRFLQPKISKKYSNFWNNRFIFISYRGHHFCFNATEKIEALKMKPKYFLRMIW